MITYTVCVAGIVTYPPPKGSPAPEVAAPPAATQFTTPTNTPQASAVTPSSGGSWQSVARKSTPTKTELSPPVKRNGFVTLHRG